MDPLKSVTFNVTESGVVGIPLDGGLTDSVLCILWAYGYATWLNMLVVKPGLLRAVYWASRTHPMQPCIKFATKALVIMANFSFVEFIVDSLCIIHQNCKYVSL